RSLSTIRREAGVSAIDKPGTLAPGRTHQGKTQAETAHTPVRLYRRFRAKELRGWNGGRFRDETIGRGSGASRDRGFGSLCRDSVLLHETPHRRAAHL